MASKREVVEGYQEQTSTEEIIYSITTTVWASTPASVAAVAYQEGTETVVTTTVFPVNSPTVAGDVITLSPLKSLTKGYTYRIEVKFTSGGNTFEFYFRIKCVK
jgi:hypothetical protein